MVTASTAPGRPKQNRFTVVAVLTRGNQMIITVRIDDETGVEIGEIDIFSTASNRNGFTYDASGAVTKSTPVSSSGAFLTTDFATFAEHPNGTTFSVRAAALETRLQSTGRIPA